MIKYNSEDGPIPRNSQYNNPKKPKNIGFPNGSGRIIKRM